MRETEGLYRAARLLKRVVIGAVVLVVVVLAGGYLFVVRQVDSQDAWTEAARELRSSVLRYGEVPVRTARVYRRRPTNYYRSVNGLLVATPQRLLFVGIEPRDKLAGEDAPAAIVTAELPNDTLVSLATGRMYAYTAHGITLRRGGRMEQFAAARGHEDELDSLAAYVERRHTAERRLAAEDRALRVAVATIEQRQIRYVVQRGDALSTIATRFGSTQQQIRDWNHLTGDRVRIGAALVVRSPR